MPTSSSAAPPTAPAAALSVRDSSPDDLPAITAIYARHVALGTATFELVAPDAAELAARRQAVLDAGWPWMVAVAGGAVVGYAYANLFRPRGAYRYCVEDSIYLAPEAQRRGAGRLLLTELITRCEARGARQMVAVIGDSSNLASIALHRTLGFHDAGVLRSTGWKLGRWLDTVLMQRGLGPGDGSEPDPCAALPMRAAP